MRQEEKCKEIEELDKEGKYIMEIVFQEKMQNHKRTLKTKKTKLSWKSIMFKAMGGLH